MKSTRELISHIDLILMVTPLKLFLDQSRWPKSLEGVEIAYPVYANFAHVDSPSGLTRIFTPHENTRATRMAPTAEELGTM